MKNYTIPILYQNGEQKSIDFSAWGGIDGFLAATSGSTDNLVQLRKIVPWLNKAVMMTANAVSQLPYEIRRGDEVIEPATAWGGAEADMQTLLYKVAGSLCSGAAYLLPETTNRAIVGLRYVTPQTIIPQFDSATGELLYFQRSYNGISARILPDDMIYFWLPDDTVEIGAAQVTPLSNAALSAGLLAAMDATLKTYGERGFVPPMFAVADGVPNAAERERAENVLSSFVRGMWRNVVKIINSKSLVPQKLGAGMEELKGVYSEVTRQQIENIAAAFNIPLSLFLSNSANYATSVTDRRLWYESGLFVTLYQCVEDTLNAQLLSRYGVEMKFLPESLDAFQQEENDKSASLASLASTFSTYPNEAIVAAGMLGYDLTDEQIAEIRALGMDDEEPQTADTDTPNDMQNDASPMALPTAEENAIAEEMKAWRKFLDRPRKREFEVKAIPPALELKIKAGLLDAGTDAKKLDAVFLEAVKELPEIRLARMVEKLLEDEK
jgi:hypothetical protein